MANNPMTMDEAYTCPRCSGMAVNVGEMEQLFSDARSEHVTCMNCGSTWRVCYKMLEFSKKIINITDAPLESTSAILDDTKPGTEEAEAN